ncbi:hypothetical protein BSL78_13874 [Apostichopus japonicus]|uniref:PH domain-containing protein n=1 Tax=Stichopus japonicus TaxID=307972 RepID=A0A2G8KMR9_STIJA|nr:hypothetical protein BSL78_13874 [Apostichopus japonicus]
MAGVYLTRDIPNEEECQTHKAPETLLTGNATYQTDINPESVDSCETKLSHEIELKVDHNGLHHMDIYRPRVLVNSFPLHRAVLPIGELSNFQVVKSNPNGNVLCVVHQTSVGPKHEFLIFQKREEMQVWIDRVNESLFPGTRRACRRSTEPTPSNIAQTTSRNDKATSAVISCFQEDDEVDDHLLTEDSEVTSAPIASVGVDVNEDTSQLSVAYCYGRSPSITTVVGAGENCQQSRLRHALNYRGDILRIRNCIRCAGLYTGDAIHEINGKGVKCEKTFRDMLKNCRDTAVEVQLTVERLPQADLQLIKIPTTKEIPFTFEGTKVKSVDVEYDEGLFMSAKKGRGFITHVNGDYVPFSSTTLEVRSRMKDFRDEFFLILHHREFAEKLG